MNVISSSYYSAERQDGVCRGTVWRQPSGSGNSSPASSFVTSSSSEYSRSCDYCVLIGPLLDCYESYIAWSKGDPPLSVYTVVGASSMPSEIAFRLVTNQGTHLLCQSTSKPCRDVWLAAFHAGLELALTDSSLNLLQQPRFAPLTPPKSNRLNIRTRRYCVSCGATDGNGKSVAASVAPLPQYGMEGRVDLCHDCSIAQGLLAHTEFTTTCLQSAQQTQTALHQARELCWNAVLSSQPQQLTTGDDEDDHSEEEPVVDLSNPTARTALQTLLQDPTQFEVLARISPFLHELSHSLVTNQISVPDFLEQLDEAAGTEDDASLGALKKQAFRVAGDMGSAMKLLLDTALPKNRQRNSSELVCILDFLLDLCAEGELASVAFFWPQLCHLHLRLLPPKNAVQVATVELVEDFLLTVSTRYSIQLALELVWSHTADLEDSLVADAVCAVACRRRRFAVLRFVCELESLLFDFDGGWGGGSVSLGRILSPTNHQVELLKERMQQIQTLRRNQHILSSSARLDLLTRSKITLHPQVAANEKLRMAKNADYFSCNLNFTRRLSDIAEKLRFMDVSDRDAALQEELELLNASGTMGGDPLNKIRDHLVRVVRVPTTEGHVFRSKERTPVLLLMEVVDEGAEVLPEASESGFVEETREEDRSPSPPQGEVVCTEIPFEDPPQGEVVCIEIPFEDESLGDHRRSSPNGTLVVHAVVYFCCSLLFLTAVLVL
jgi:hypothetical protein